MIKVFRWIERHFILFFLLAVLLGLWGKPLSSTNFVQKQIIALLTLVMFLAFLRIPFADILQQMRNYRRLFFILILFQVVYPIFFFKISSMCSDSLELSIAVMLLAVVPPGVAATPITQILRGNASLTLVVCSIATLAIPFSLPMVCYFLLHKIIILPYLQLISSLFIMIVCPFLGAELVKKYASSKVQMVMPYTGGISMILLSYLLLIVIRLGSTVFWKNPWDALWIIGIFFVVTFLFQVVGWLGGWGLKYQDQLALSITKSVTNTALAIVIATNFFSDYPQIAFYLILSEIPWSIMPGMYRFYSFLWGKSTLFVDREVNVKEP